MITIVDYGMSNLRSVAKAVQVAGGKKVIISSKKYDFKNATHIILPGQGAFPDGINNLRKYGLIEELKNQIEVIKKPFLGICLGLQLLSTLGFESGKNDGLNLVPGNTIRLSLDENRFKLPHIGWDDVTYNSDCPLFKDLPKSPDFYFDHSYFLEPKTPHYVVATCTYGSTFPVAFWNNHLFATLFHPEKSQRYGIQLLKNFLQFQK